LWAALNCKRVLFFLKVTASVALRLVWLFLCINCPEDQIARSTRAERLHVNIPPRLTSQLVDFQGFADVVSATGDSGSAENLFHKCPSAERHDRTKTGFCKLTINQRSSRLPPNKFLFFFGCPVELAGIGAQKGHLFCFFFDILVRMEAKMTCVIIPENADVPGNSSRQFPY